MKKLQTPTSKLQRNTKLQAPNGLKRPQVVRYDITTSEGLTLREDANGEGKARHAFYLEERTAKFGEAIIKFCKRIPRHPANDRLINQLAGCGTSVGANYCEANEGVSKKDFLCSIGRCNKEAKETKFFLRIIAASEPPLADEARTLYREAKELQLIFASMFRNGR